MAEHVVGDRLDVLRGDESAVPEEGVRARGEVQVDGGEGRGAVLDVAGQIGEAAKLADRGLRLAREGKERGYEAWALRLLGEIASRRDPPDIEQATAHYRQAIGLAEVRGMPQRNLAVELLQKLLKGELSIRRRKNVVQARSFADMLEQTIRRYQSRALEAAQVIEELIQLAKDMRAASARGEALGLTDDELAFYDALETNDSAVKVLGDETLRGIARELVETVRKNVTIDWMLRENVRAHLRVLVKRILRKHGYPPDKQEKATQTVLEQAALLSGEWAVA